jgi:Abnormal spindle-like microcephaly-assoc'd, ASPM-SPD-2-Hydin
MGETSVVVQVTPSVSFGNEPYGQKTSAQSVTVSNRGSAPLTVQSANLGGSDAGDFAVASNACGGQSVAPGGSCTVSVTFTPTAVGERTATLSVADNANPSPQTVTLSGDGTGTPDVTLNPSPPAPLNLTNNAPNGQVTLTNSGSAPLSVASVTLSGINASEFQKDADQCSGQTIDPGKSCVVTVAFTPALTATTAETSSTTQTSTTTEASTAHARAFTPTAALNFADTAASSPQAVIVEYL